MFEEPPTTEERLSQVAGCFGAAVAMLLLFIGLIALSICSLIARLI